MTNRMFSLFDLLEWLEALLDHRHEHVGEWYMFFATDERYMELNIVDDEIWAGAVTNYNLSKEQWLGDRDHVKLYVFGWVLEEIESPEPKYVKRWHSSAETKDIVSDVLRLFTSVYLDKETELVEVVRGSFANGNVGWESTL